MVKVLTKTITHMACECDLITDGLGEVIHPLPENVFDDVCSKVALVKFEISGEGLWLCPKCVTHYRRNE